MRTGGTLKKSSTPPAVNTECDLRRPFDGGVRGGDGRTQLFWLGQIYVTEWAESESQGEQAPPGKSFVQDTCSARKELGVARKKGGAQKPLPALGQSFPKCSSTYSPIVTLQNCVEFVFGHILIWNCYDNGRDVEVKSVGDHNFGKYIVSNL